MLLKNTQVLLSLQRTALKLRFCFQLYSKSAVSNILALSNTEAKNERLSNDPFSLLVSNGLIKKSTVSNNTLSIQSNDCLQKIQVIEEQCPRNPYYEEFLNYIEGQSKLEENCNELNVTISLLSQNLHLLSTEQLARLTNSIATEKKSSHFLADLISKLDRECSIRSVKWDKSLYIKIAWSFYLINSHGFWRLHKQIVADLAGQIQQMTPQELVIYLSIVKLFRKFPHEVDMHKLEQRLYEVVNNLSIEDLGLACLAFFECNKEMRNLNLIIELTKRLVASPKTTDEKTVGSMLKIFRKSSMDSSIHVKEVLDLQSRLYTRIDEWGPKVLMQLVGVSSNLLFFHHPTIERVIERFLKIMDQARLKDVERLAMAIAISCHFTPNSQHFWNEIEKEFTKEERFQEIFRYPHSFTSLVAYAVNANRFPEGLLRIALSPKFTENAEKFVEQHPFYSGTKRELLLLHCSVNLERPEYDGPRLKKEHAQEYEKLYRKPIPKKGRSHKLSNHDVFLLLLLDAIQEILGESDTATLTYLQPHFATPDIVFRLKNSETQTPNSSETRRFAVVGGSRNMYSKFLKQPMGPLCMKIRQLELMGYIVIPIPWFEFLPLSLSGRIALVKHEIVLAQNRPQ